MKVLQCTKAPKEYDHSPICDGKCGELIEIPDYHANLAIEMVRWNRMGMIAQGVPTSLSDAAPGIPIEILETSLKTQNMMEVLLEKGILTEEEVNERYCIMAEEFFRKTREANEERIRRQRIAAGVGKKTLFGPNGEVLN